MVDGERLRGAPQDALPGAPQGATGAPLPQDARQHAPYGTPAPTAPFPAAGGMWRWLNFLPVKEPILYPLPVGGTPLIAPPGLRQDLGLDLWLKDETRGPTASNKDRATALVLQQALASGAETVSCASTGNVAVSLAVGAAAAGLRAVIFVPAGVNEHKLALMRLAGATVVKVREGYTAAFQLSSQAAGAWGWCDRNTGINPLTVEAKKTVALEIWEQLGGAMPDVVVAPVGDGVTLAALYRGFRELVDSGAGPEGSRPPRIIGVQAAGADPVRRAWAAGTDRIDPVVPHTIADGIAVGAPIFGAEALAAVRSSGGGFVAVSDEDLLAAMGRLASRAGLLAEPSGASATAGVIQAIKDGLIAPGERVVALVTGSVLKTPGFVTAALAGGAPGTASGPAGGRPTGAGPSGSPRPGRVIEIPADLDALRQALDTLT